jgi:hypothetical protein
MAFIYDMIDTWNSAGITFTSIKMNVTDTASNANSLLMDLQIGGASRFRVNKEGALSIQNSVDTGGLINAGSNGFRVLQLGGSTVGSNGNLAIRESGVIVTRGGGSFSWENGGNNPATGTIDLTLARDAANTLAQRNGVNAQALRVYGTFTDASNYERGFIRAQAGNLQIGFERAGTGSNRILELVGGNGIAFNALSSGIVWQINSSGHFVAGTDNTYDIGASGANRPRNMFLAGLLNFGGVSLQATGNTAVFTNNGNSQTLTIGIATNTLMIGGITSSFPALKRSTTSLQARLADDSAFTNIQGKLTTETAYTAGSIVPTGFLTLYDSTGTAYRVPCVV